MTTVRFYLEDQDTPIAEYDGTPPDVMEFVWITDKTMQKYAVLRRELSLIKHPTGTKAVFNVTLHQMTD